MSRGAAYSLYALLVLIWSSTRVPSNCFGQAQRNSAQGLVVDGTGSASTSPTIR